MDVLHHSNIRWVDEMVCQINRYIGKSLICPWLMVSPRSSIPARSSWHMLHDRSIWPRRVKKNSLPCSKNGAAGPVTSTFLGIPRDW